MAESVSCKRVWHYCPGSTTLHLIDSTCVCNILKFCNYCSHTVREKVIEQTGCFRPFIICYH